MKKILTIMCVLTMMVLTSCEKEELNWKIREYTINADDWELVGNPDELNSHYIYEFKESDITNYIYTKGVINGYRILSLNDGSQVQTPLPYVVPIGEQDGNNEKLWSEYYTFDFKSGSIAFYAYYTDFYTANKPPTCTFRIVMNW